MGRLIVTPHFAKVSRLTIAILLAACLMGAGLANAQRPAGRRGTPPDTQQKDDNKLPSDKELEKKKAEAKATQVKLSPVELLVETSIFAYGGRKGLETARAAIHEEGTIRLASDQGDLTGSYSLRAMRREKSWLDLLRVDLEMSPPGGNDSNRPAIKYVIGFNGASVWSAQNGQYMTLAPSAERAFRAQLTHEYTALLRYKEDGSKIELAGPDTVVGVETNMIDLTTPNGDKTRFWVSTKTYRVVQCEYEVKLDDSQPPTKYLLKYFYTPFKVVQNTLVPVRRLMTQDGKFVQEITITSAVYSAKLDPEIFQHLQEQ
ncbi:MAG TPA: hypothetical protein VKA60_26380 [Blastocatellia bacterium]|nr:hypothetical protein [Blastocatellia bacterium]